MALLPVWVGALKASIYMACATLAYLCLVGGLVWLRPNALHRRLMLTGISLDVGIVLALELSRSAVATTLSNEPNNYQMLHIISSLTAVLLYAPTVALGVLRWRQLGLPRRAAASRSAKLVKWHRIFGASAFMCRSIGWIFMFAW